MFNPKEELQKIRRKRAIKQDSNHYITDTPVNLPLFDDQTKLSPPQQIDLHTRLAKLETFVNDLNAQLQTSKDTIKQLKRENNQLQTQVLRLQYENSQLRSSNKIPDSKPVLVNSKKAHVNESTNGNHIVSEGKSNGSLSLKPCKSEHSKLKLDECMPEVKEAIEQISKEPIEQILKRKEHNFRALKQEQRIINMKGNKWLQELAQIEKDYSKTLKKPVLVIRLNSEDFE